MRSPRRRRRRRRLPSRPRRPPRHRETRRAHQHGVQRRRRGVLDVGYSIDDDESGMVAPAGSVESPIEKEEKEEKEEEEEEDDVADPATPAAAGSLLGTMEDIDRFGAKKSDGGGDARGPRRCARRLRAPRLRRGRRAGGRLARDASGPGFPRRRRRSQARGAHATRRQGGRAQTPVDPGGRGEAQHARVQVF